MDTVKRDVKLLNKLNGFLFFYIFVLEIYTSSKSILKSVKNYYIMKKFNLITLIFILIITGLCKESSAQKNTTVNQVIVVNSGRFETVPPFFDYVTVQTYDPVTHAVVIFDTIYTQSAQDVLIVDHFAYVAAQDSLIKYDIDTHQRLAAIQDSGMSKLGFYNDMLIVTKQAPIVRFRLEALNSSNLALLGSVENISGDCGGMVADKDSIYVAVNGGYLGTEGKIAVIDPGTWTVTREINLGAAAIGIWNLYSYNGFIYSVNRTPFGAGNVGSISKYSLYNYTFTNKVLNVVVGDGYGINGELLYLGLNYGIGSYNLMSDAIADTIVINDPGSVNHIYILNGALDYVNNYLYMNIGNRTTFGIGVVGSTAGDSITSFSEGLSADCIAIDFRTPVGISKGNSNEQQVSVFPNPVRDVLHVNLTKLENEGTLRIFDVTGRLLKSVSIPNNENNVNIDCSSYLEGVYFVSVTSGSGVKTLKFIKK